MERDYPVGHPAASDYKGEKYTPPRAPFTDDFAANHPAHLGRNIKPLDTPDGMRAAVLDADANNAVRTALTQAGNEQPDSDEPTQTPATIKLIKALA